MINLIKHWNQPECCSKKNFRIVRLCETNNNIRCVTCSEYKKHRIFAHSHEQAFTTADRRNKEVKKVRTGLTFEYSLHPDNCIL